jgi:hypothetical protein
MIRAKNDHLTYWTPIDVCLTPNSVFESDSRI